jgi:hypothetical protein
MATLGSTVALQAEYRKRLLVPNGTKDSFVDIGDIEWIEASDYYAWLHEGARTLCCARR